MLRFYGMSARIWGSQREDTQESVKTCVAHILRTSGRLQFRRREVNSNEFRDTDILEQ
jgi:hypothetical protein